MAIILSRLLPANQGNMCRFEKLSTSSISSIRCITIASKKAIEDDNKINVLLSVEGMTIALHLRKVKKRLRPSAKQKTSDFESMTVVELQQQSSEIFRRAELNPGCII